MEQRSAAGQPRNDLYRELKCARLLKSRHAEAMPALLAKRSWLCRVGDARIALVDLRSRVQCFIQGAIASVHAFCHCCATCM
jgi:hypothetical protein